MLVRSHLAPIIGRVRIARHSKTGQYAAVKIVSKNTIMSSRMSLRSLGDDAERILHSIEREIVIMKLIDHPNIMRLYDVWETSSELFLILEYVEGGELFDYLCNKGRLVPSEALGYFQQIITAIHYCHRFNIAHRDLKPENLLLDKNKNIKVADFGMAAWQGKNDMLQTACGSPHYAAPEVIMGRAYNGSSSDIWSCGVILFALLAGRLPFDDEDLPTLLEKVKLGRYMMPPDIDSRAKNLISRMLEKDVNKRITIPEILSHPFYLSQKPKKMSHDVPNLDDIARPLKDQSQIDPDIFANLRTLWYGRPDQEIVASLTNKQPTWEKGVYHLLVRYREKHMEDYDEEEEKQLAARRASKRRGKKSPEAENAHTPKSLPPRAGPPAPSRVVRDDGLKVPATLGPEMIKLRQVPLLSSGFLSAISGNKSSNKMPEKPDFSLLTSPLLAPPASGPRGPRAMNALRVPEIQDQKVQQFLQQVADRLNAISTSTPVSARPERNLQLSPLPAVPPPPTPASAIGQEISPSNPVQPPTDGFDADLADDNATRPLSIRRRARETVPGEVDADKENLSQRPMLTVKTTFNSDQYLHTSDRNPSVRSDGSADRRVHIQEPSPGERSRLKKKRSVGHSPAPNSASSDGSFVLSSTPKRRWFPNVFKFRPTTFTLLSLYDAFHTHETCRRLLEDMGVSVALAHAPPTESSEFATSTLTLKCKLEEIKDAESLMSTVKGVKFRVEMHRPNAVQVAAGYGVQLRLVLEKGAATSLKLIYNRLRREWDLDSPTTPYDMSGPDGLGTDRDNFVHVVYAN